jgi:hypothetical protein
VDAACRTVPRRLAAAPRASPLLAVFLIASASRPDECRVAQLSASLVTAAESTAKKARTASAMAAPAHAQPAGDCMVCMDELSAENYCEYRTHADSAWQPAKICANCLEHMRKSALGRAGARRLGG